MFLLTTAFALSFLGLFANAQLSNCTVSATNITDIRDHFESADLVVPDLLPSFNPSALMTVTFSGVGPISPGQNLSTEETVLAPNVTITPVNSSVSVTGNFTLIMVDASNVETNESNGQVLHWLTNFAILQNDSSSSGCPSLDVSIDSSEAVVINDYISPQPPANTGLHRYAILLYPQPDSFSPPANLSSPIDGIDLHFHLKDYASSLDQPIAGMFFEVQANVTIPPTSAVVTGTSSLTPSVSSSVVRSSLTPSALSSAVRSSLTPPVSSSSV